MNYLLISLFLLVLNINLFASDVKPLKTYSKAKIITNDYQRLTAKEISLFKTHITYINPTTRKSETIPLDKVEMVFARTGNRFMEGTISGAALGFLIGWRIGIVGDPDDYSKTMLISTAVSAGISGIIGLFIDSYDVVFQNQKFLISDATRVPGTQSYTLFSYSLSF